MTKIERKCRNCGTWNNASERCEQCGEALAPEVIRKEEVAEIEANEAAKPPDKFAVLLSRLKQSSNPFLLLLYGFLYSIWAVYMAILAFIIFIIAWTPG